MSFVRTPEQKAARKARRAREVKHLWDGAVYGDEYVLVKPNCMGAHIVLQNPFNPATGNGFLVDRQTSPVLGGSTFYFKWPLTVIQDVNARFGIIHTPTVVLNPPPPPPRIEVPKRAPVPKAEKACSDCEKAKQQTEQAAGEPECVVCMDAKCSRIFLPCHHICCCSVCSKQVNDCPSCRTPIQHVHIVYM